MHNFPNADDNKPQLTVARIPQRVHSVDGVYISVSQDIKSSCGYSTDTVTRNQCSDS